MKSNYYVCSTMQRTNALFMFWNAAIIVVFSDDKLSMLQ